MWQPIVIACKLLAVGAGTRNTTPAVRTTNPLYVSQVIDSQAMCQSRDFECKTNCTTKKRHHKCYAMMGCINGFV
mgnify:CR=1 FL=1